MTNQTDVTVLSPETAPAKPKRRTAPAKPKTTAKSKTAPKSGTPKVELELPLLASTGIEVPYASIQQAYGNQIAELSFIKGKKVGVLYTPESGWAMTKVPMNQRQLIWALVISVLSTSTPNGCGALQFVSANQKSYSKLDIVLRLVVQDGKGFKKLEYPVKDWAKALAPFAQFMSDAIKASPPAYHKRTAGKKATQEKFEFDLFDF